MVALSKDQMIIIAGVAILLFLFFRKQGKGPAKKEGFCEYKDCAPELAGGQPAANDAGKITGVAAEIAQQLQEQQFLDATTLIGIDTINQQNSNPCLDIRGSYSIPKVDTLFNQSSIMTTDLNKGNRITIGMGDSAQ